MGSCEHDISFSLAAVDNFIDLQYGEGPPSDKTRSVLFSSNDRDFVLEL